MRIYEKMGLKEIYNFDKRVRLLFTILLVSGIILLADQNVMSPNIQAIENEFKIGDKEIGLIGSAFTIIASVVTLLWGYLSDKYSRRILLIITTLLGEIPCFLTGFAESYHQMLFLRVLTGIGIGGSVPIAFSLIGDFFTEKTRPRAQAWYDAITTIGVLLGMIIAGFLGPALGWRVPFMVVSAPNFLFVIGMLFAKEPPRGAGEQEIREYMIEGKQYKGSLRLKDYLRLLKVPTNIWLFLQGIPGTVAWGIIPFYLIVFYQRYKHFPVQLGTVLLIILGLGTVLGKLLGGLIGNSIYLKKRSLLPIFLGVMQLIGVVPILITLMWPAPQNPTIKDLLVPGIFGFLGALLISTSGPNVRAILMNVNLPEHRGAISSIFNLTDNIGMGLGPFIGGLISSVKGLDFAMTTSALFWIPCGLLLFVVATSIEKDALKVRSRMEEMRKEIEHEKA
ncbi:MAG: MFS transporter [Caldisericum sp.]|jgi:predicted MFS family arabinose efflux permease|nr:MFS transporter [Caldisericum sp.]